jgi:hypothetical protein
MKAARCGPVEIYKGKVCSASLSVGYQFSPSFLSGLQRKTKSKREYVGFSLCIKK